MNDKPEWKNLPRWCRHVSNKWTTLSNEPLYTMSHGNVVMEKRWRVCPICGAKRPKGRK